MTYKRHWDDKKEGLTPLYKLGNSGCHAMEIDGLFLKAGSTYSGDTAEMEYGLTLLGGTCTVKGADFDYAHIGKRKNVFDGKAYAVYLPRHTAFTVEADTDLKIMIAKCPADADHVPVLVTPDDVIVKNLGKPGFEREAHFLVDERMEACRIYIGENFIRGGQWSSFPGHKHDVNNMPTEGFAEEIYYYEYDKPTGYGIQQVYTADRAIDEAYPVRNGDIVEIPKGYHPCCVAPGYTGYLLWMMSCDNRGFYMTADPEQDWQNH